MQELDSHFNLRASVSFTSSISLGNGPSGAPALSADGSSIAFASLASNLVIGDTNITTRSPGKARVT
jgi:hypothetical protein